MIIVAQAADVNNRSPFLFERGLRDLENYFAIVMCVEASLSISSIASTSPNSSSLSQVLDADRITLVSLIPAGR